MGAATVILGLLVILIPLLIFPVCGFGRHAPPPGQAIGSHLCHGTLYTEIVVGIFAVLSGLLMLIRPERQVVAHASTWVVILAVVGVSLPTALTGVCKMPTMPCRTGTVPALVIATGLMACAGILGLILGRDKRRHY